MLLVSILRRPITALIVAIAIMGMSVPSVAQTGLSFDGSNDYVTFGAATTELGVTNFTLEAWVYRVSGGVVMSTGTNGFDGNGGRPNGAYPVLTKGMGEGESPKNINTNFFLGITVTGYIGADFEDSTNGGNHPVWGVTLVPLDEWHHIAATYNGQVWNLYLDGVLDKTLDLGAVYIPEWRSIQHGALGTGLNSSGGLSPGRFKGVIDEPRVWNVVRTQGQIQADLDSAVTAGTGLLGRWGLDEGTGTTANNSVGGSVNGTLTNGPLWVAGAPALAPPAVPPDAPTGLAATAVSPYRIDLSWTDNSDNETTFEVWRSTDGGSIFTRHDSTAVNAVAYQDSLVNSAAEYHYRVRAANSSGNSAYTSDDSATTSTEGSSALDLGSAGAYVTFGAAPELATQTFTVETWFKRTGTGTANTTGGGGITLIPLLAKGAPQAEASTVDANYILGIQSGTDLIAADFEEGTGSTSPGLNHPLVGTTAVTNNVWHHAAATFTGGVLKIYLDGVLENTLDLGASVYPQGASIQHAALGTMLTSTGGANGRFQGVLDEARVWNYARSDSAIMATINMQITDTRTGLIGRWGVNEGSGVKVNGNAGAFVDGTVTGTGSSWAAGAPFNIAPPGPPAAPDNLAAAAAGAHQIDLTWSDSSSNETWFQIERSTFGIGGPYVLYDSVGANVTAWSDFAVPELSQYCYRVRAINALGNSSYTSSECATTSAETAGALQFGGTNAYVTFGDPAALRLSQFTLETWFRRDGPGVSNTTGTGGITSAIPLIAKGAAETEDVTKDLNYFLGIDAASGVVCADFEEGSGGSSPSQNHPVYGTTVISTGTWYHAAVTYDGTNWRLYLNGVLETDTAIGQPVASTTISPVSFATSLRSDGTTAQGFFHGVMDEVRIWDYPRTQPQIMGSVNLQISSPQAGLVGRWNLNEAAGTDIHGSAGTTSDGTVVGSNYAWVGPAPFNISGNQPPDQPVLVSPSNGATGEPVPVTLSVQVSDPEATDLTVNFYGREVGPGSGGEDFTIIALPDVQYYTGQLNGGTNAIFKAQTQWIVNNLVTRNIKYVTQLGDCVEHGDNSGNPIEWMRADTAMKFIEDPVTTLLSEGIPYGITVGNHDQSPIGNPDGTTTFYNQYFGETRFSGRAYYGGHYGSSNDNHFQLFSGGGMDFIAVSLEYDTSPDGPILHWADSLLKAYSDRRAIIISHWIINSGNPGSFGTQGQVTYDSLKDNPNLFLMLCGHVTSGEGRRSDTFGGNVVNSLLSDYQSRTNGGNGWLRIMEFSPANDVIHVKTYSPTLDQYETDGDSQFDIPYEMAGGSPAPFVLLGTNTGVTSGSTTDFVWSGLSPGTDYEWYVEVIDSSSTTGPTWTFTTSSGGPSHTITSTAYGIGSIAPTGSVIVSEGSDQAFTITPSGGYHTDSVVVDGANLGVRAAYTFTNVLAAHTIDAYFSTNQTFSPAYYSTIVLDPLTTSAETGEKPQSKVWLHDGRWWSVLSTSGGTHIYRLDGTTWTSVYQVSTATDVHADVKKAGEVVHILLYRGTASELASAQYNSGSNTYEAWASRGTNATITLDSGVETATIDIDGTGRMWLASDVTTQIVVRYSDSPYSSWSSPITLATGVNSDDISAVIALPTGKVGVLWSNQSTQRFGFRIHTDGADPATWGADEVPASQSALSVGLGMADDHLNLSVASDGTIYAAVKTSYDAGGYPKIAMLVRHPWGAWDDLYGIDESGTRAVVVLNENEQTVTVVYTASEGFNNIVYRRSALHPISFGAIQTLIAGSYNNVTTMKDVDVDDVVYLASSASSTVGVLTATTAPDLVGHWAMDEGSGTTLVDSSTYSNDGTIAGSPSWVTGMKGQALALNGTSQYATVPDDASLDITGAITLATWVRPEKYATQDLIKKAIQGSVDGYELALASTGSSWPNRPFVRFNQAASGDTYRLSARTVSTYPIGGSWMHIAATYDGATIKLYIDGVLDTSTAAAISIGSNATDLGIGAQSNNARWFQGQMDDARIYNRALSGPEILALATVTPVVTDTITASAGPNGLISPSGVVVVNEGSNQAFTITPDPGFLIDSVIVDGGKVDSTTSYTFVNVTANHTISATFVAGPSLVAHWAMDEGSGTTMLDSSTYLNNGTISGSPSWVTGMKGQAISLNGTSQYASVPDAASLDITAAITMSAWISPTARGTQRIIYKTDGANGYELFLSANTPYYLSVRLNGSNSQRVNTHASYPINGDWMHVAATWDGSNLKMYIDGILDSVIASATTIAANNAALGVGARPTGSEYLSGRLDDVRIYNRALDASEILALASSNDTITATAGPNGSISPSGTVAVATGSNQAFTITPNAGYHIDSVLVDEVPVDSTTSYTFVNVTAAHAIRAVFAINQYTITPTAGSNGTITPSVPTAVNHGANQAFTITPNAGYHIDSVLVDEVPVDSTTSYTFTNVTAAHTIRAVFAINQYAITPTAGASGAIAPSVPTAVDHGSNQAFTITPNAGYHIDSVLVDEVPVDSTTSYTFTNVTAAHTIRAVFAINQYAIALTAVNGTVTKSPDQALYDSNSVVQLSAIPAVGYQFAGWSGDATGTTNPLNVTMDAAKNITALFAINQYTMNVTAVNGTVTKSPDQALYDSNSVVELTATAAVGYSFTGWSGDATGTTNPLNVTMDAAKNITASFAIKQYAVNLTAANGTVSKSPDQALYDSNTVVQLTAVPATGYEFDGWSGDATGDDNPLDVTMNGVKNITATFSLKEYAVNITAVNGTVVKSPDQTLYDSNSVVQLTAVPSAGYTFTGWSGDASGTANPLNVTMDAAKNITASFAINQYAIAITAVNGTVTKSPDQTLYDSNSVVQLTAVPSAGYTFTGWSGDASGTANPLNVTMDAAKNITALFTIDQYPLIITAEHGTVTKSPDQALYDSNSVVELTAVPEPGYEFDGWEGDATGNDNPLEVTMDGGKDITALFSLLPVEKEVTVRKGWNIISVPVEAPDHNRTVLFPGSTTPGYTYDGGYVAHDVLPHGVGYWMKFPDDGMANLTGETIDEDTITVSEGWNMVGSLSEPLDVSEVQSIPPGLVTGTFFAYDGSYSAVSVIEPGQGYWVKVSAAGQLVFSISGPVVATNLIRIVPDQELPPTPPDLISGGEKPLPSVYALRQNFPNPFNPNTVIEYDLPEEVLVTLSVYNIIGQQVALLVNEIQEAGMRTVTLDGTELSTGVYLCRIAAGSYIRTIRMVLMK